MSLSSSSICYISAFKNCIYSDVYEYTLCKLVSLWMCVCTTYMQVPTKQQGNTDSPEAEVTDACEQPCWCWEMNLGPRREQPGLLTTKPLLQLLTFSSFKCQRCVRNLGGFFVCLFLPKLWVSGTPSQKGGKISDLAMFLPGPAY